MTLTKEQIIARILPGQVTKRRRDIVWGDIVAAVASASATQKNSIVTNLKTKDYPQVGKILAEIVFAALKVEVTQDLETKLANNSLNLDELSEILE
jgi:hypothetical protein